MSFVSVGGRPKKVETEELTDLNEKGNDEDSIDIERTVDTEDELIKETIEI